MRATALITGGSGYFGSLLVQKLLEHGHICRVFDINDANNRPPEVEFIQGDIRDFDAVSKACEDIKFVYHNVAQVPLAKDKQLFESVNVFGTENLLKAALAKGVKKVIYTSSSAVYGAPSYNPVTEELPPSPSEAYGMAKYNAECRCKNFTQSGLDISIIRPRTILGHGRLGIFQILFEWIREGSNVPVLGCGENIYQFLHSDDLAEACILAAKKPGPAIYNCGTDRFGSMRDVLQYLCNYAGTGSKVKSLPMAPAVAAMKVTNFLGLSPLGAYHALMYGRSMYFDISKIRSELGWQPKYSNNEMFVQSYEWYLKNREMVLASHGGSQHQRALKQGILRFIKWVL